MFLVFSNFDFQFLTMTSRGGQYYYRFSGACRLIEYNSSISKLKELHQTNSKSAIQEIRENLKAIIDCEDTDFSDFVDA